MRLSDSELTVWVKNQLESLGIRKTKVVITSHLPGIAAIPLLNTIMISKRILPFINAEDLKAILAHEAYHLSSRYERKRLIRNSMLSLAAYLILIDIFLLMSLPYFMLITFLLPDALPPLPTAGLLGVSILFFLATLLLSIRVSRRIISRLMKYIPFGVEEMEANEFASRIVGRDNYWKAVASYSIALRRAAEGKKLLKFFWMNSLLLNEAVNPHPTPTEVGEKA